MQNVSQVQRPGDSRQLLAYCRDPADPGLDNLKSELERLITENSIATEGQKKNQLYETLVDSLGYDEGIIQDIEDSGLLDEEWKVLKIE